MPDNHETDRTLGDVARFGTIATVDRAAARITVKIGDALSGPIRWASIAGTALTIWSPPSIGEQVLLICPEGELAAAIALRGLYSDAHPAPASDEAHSLHFGDGALLRYDPVGHALSVSLPEGGTIDITAPGGITITADVDIIGDVAITGDLDVTGEILVTGPITATDDVTGQGTSLATHRHTGVDTGSGTSGPPA